MLSVRAPDISSPAFNPHLSTQSLTIERVPLQELPTSSSGTLLAVRAPTERPRPSFDVENIFAILSVVDNTSRMFRQHGHRLDREVRRRRRRRIRLQNAQRAGLVRTAGADSYPATRMSAHPRLSLGLDSDGSGSEPDVSMLALARAAAEMEQQAEDEAFDDEVMAQAEYEADDTSVEDDEVVEQVVENMDSEDEAEDQVVEPVPLADPATLGLKEISNLAKFTVSSHKQGNGVEELRSDDLKLYWQSDGPQPHRLTVYFVKRVGIRDIRFYVNYTDDESYTPTKIVFKSGTSENNLIEFASMTMESPVGWQQVPVAGAGGDPDGNTLVSYVLQMQILENHQNGKDTHLRGIKIYAFDTESAQGPGRDGGDPVDVVGLVDEAPPAGGRRRGAQEDSGEALAGLAGTLAATRLDAGEGGFSIPDFMREPELR